MPEHVRYSYLNEGIYCFTWLDRSEDAANEYYNLISSLYDELPEETSAVRILHDYRQTSALPVSSVLSKIRSLHIKYPNLKRRIAYISDNELIESLVISLVLLSNRSGTRQFFRANEKQEAINWLLEES